MSVMREIIARTQRAECAAEAPEKSTLIRRSTLHSAGFALVALLCAGGVVAVVKLALPLIAFSAGLTLSLGALLFAVASVYGAWRGPCPACDADVSFPSPHGVTTRCSECDAELESVGGRSCLAAPRRPAYTPGAPRSDSRGGSHAARQAHDPGHRIGAQEPGAARLVIEGRQAA